MGNGQAGSMAPLSEMGYQELAKLRNDEEMAIFCERILARDGKVVTNRGDLTGFVPFYSGTKSVQSFEALANELKSVPWTTSHVGGGGRWDESVLLEGNSAGDRKKWLMANKHLSEAAAIQQVMGEYPRAFAYDPDANCDGLAAKERVTWLKDNQGLSESAAKAQVMREFPTVFRWLPDTDCSGVRAEDRALWLERNAGKSKADARAQVMADFPGAFN
mmetsp:Transcript_69897/g.167783  ORF Transcript_69897/g.167783 Transcript_69897/m.167783 type:complete len:218 (+) Transcript_69897:115-768(+)|eukprot:CAMPEP_0178427784 /NCGR_PEP_ID=MMETSP0689_2-20121128/29923_1 /TAXON_ID=160604 /ORGANISM="Amphidinium massartii, Strain CS-259" /LENGTH=217 /DNA_ID=CAMNT_0020049501 /DNA_START=114 /DNA_END=767 /DNA_ORIENTATION=+